MAKKPIIAVDIDDVLADSAKEFVEYSNKKWGTSLTPDDYDEHWAKMWKIDEAELKERAHHIYDSNIQRTFSRFDGAMGVLEELVMHYELVITTSRVQKVQTATYEWLDKHFKGVFSAVHFAGIWDAGHDSDHAIGLTKADLHKRLEVGYMIDDHPKHCLAADNLGIKALLFGDYRWNRDIEVPDSIVRVRDWQAVKEFFDAERRRKL